MLPVAASAVLLLAVPLPLLTLANVAPLPPALQLRSVRPRAQLDRPRRKSEPVHIGREHVGGCESLAPSASSSAMAHTPAG